MIFTPTEDQSVILNALERLTSRHATLSVEQMVQRTVRSLALESELTDAGFLGIGIDTVETATSAALVVAELAKLPIAIEVVASALVRPAAFDHVRGPVALIDGDADKPTRFLPDARSVCIVGRDDVRIAEIEPGDVTEVDSLFAYPMGVLSPSAAARARILAPDTRETVLRWWRIGLALEIYGALDSAMRMTVDHVTERRQFGRPLGAFQAVQHRLAMSATAVQACRWLALAAVSNDTPAAAAMAAAYAQNAARTVAYDLHQFSGAMGLTLEYPLHLFTYRTKLLQAELGGNRRHFTVVADKVWPREAEQAA